MGGFSSGGLIVANWNVTTIAWRNLSFSSSGGNLYVDVKLKNK